MDYSTLSAADQVLGRVFVPSHRRTEQLVVPVQLSENKESATCLSIHTVDRPSAFLDWKPADYQKPGHLVLYYPVADPTLHARSLSFCQYQNEFKSAQMLFLLNTSDTTEIPVTDLEPFPKEKNSMQLGLEVVMKLGMVSGLPENEQVKWGRATASSTSKEPAPKKADAKDS